jgi:glycosyltransferase involved in cell wall biosynthesis
MKGTIPGTHIRIASTRFVAVAALAAGLTVFTIAAAVVCTAIRLVADRLGLSPGRRRSDGSAFDLLCLSQVPWQGMWQRNQHTMSRLARNGRVIYARPISTIEAADNPRHLAFVFGPEVRENLRVVSPVILWGDTRSGSVRWLNRLLVASSLRFALWRAGGGGLPVVLWFYFPRWDYLCGALGESLVVYDIQDDYTTWTNATRDIAERERRLLRRADVVFTGTRSLCRRKVGLHPDMRFVQNGVESAHFARARADETEIPAALAGLPRPVIGYFGLIGDRIDTGILDLLAERHPEWSIVLVGPVREEMCAVPDRPNIHLTGPADYADLPGYLKGFDVAIIPYLLNETTMDLNPTKLLEYLAGGRPVVSTAMHDVVELFGDRVGVARDPEEFLALTEAAVDRPDPERIERNVEFAMGFTWDAMVERMRSMVIDALDRAGSPGGSAPADGGACEQTTGEGG